MLKKVLNFLVFDVIETIVIALAIFVIIDVFITSPHVVSGESMEKSFLNNEFIFINELDYRFGTPERGDVIVFAHDPTHDYIKRIIGLPGDKVMLHNGNVYLNGLELNESLYLTPGNMTYGLDFLANDKTITVPKGEYFVLGDNREESSDSREWGFVEKSAIHGRAWVVYWPANEAEVVSRVKYVKEGDELVAKKAG